MKIIIIIIIMTMLKHRDNRYADFCIILHMIIIIIIPANMYYCLLFTICGYYG